MSSAVATAARTDRIPIALRDRIVTEFRETVARTCAIVPLAHQATWWAAADGQVLLPSDAPETGWPHRTVRLPDDTVVSRALVPRPAGRARVIAELAAFKAGKSFGAALWATGFAAVPGARVPLLGVEYDMCTPEFEYLLEFLLSERGMNLSYASLQNRPKDGRLWLELENGARFEGRSWDRSESLKGKAFDAVLVCEAYQLPGLECYTAIKQNLRERQGTTVFTTTPDRPWLAILHEHGHGDPAFEDWACFCGVASDVNPRTFDQAQKTRDQLIMTGEKFAIAHEGKIGTYIGHVYAYQRGQRPLGAAPAIARLRMAPDAPITRQTIRIPVGWKLELGVDTGTYLAAVLTAFDPPGDAYVLDECVNYRYVAGQPELDAALSLPGWAERVLQMVMIWGARPVGWCDQNSQFRQELLHYRITLIGQPVALETRTEVTRSYFQHDRIWFAPWLQVLPYELEQQRWPEEVSASGKYQRLKKQDHAVDCLEHVCARHPHGRVVETASPRDRARRWPYAKRQTYNPVMGRY